LTACHIYVNDDHVNVGEMQMTKFSSNLPVKSTLTAGQSLVKLTLRFSLNNQCLQYNLNLQHTYVQCTMSLY